MIKMLLLIQLHLDAKIFLNFPKFITFFINFSKQCICFLVKEWDNYMIELTKYTLEDLQDCINAIKQII